MQVLMHPLAQPEAPLPTTFTISTPADEGISSKVRRTFESAEPTFVFLGLNFLFYTDLNLSIVN